MKKLMLFIVFILIICNVSALQIVTDENYELYNINKCYDYVKIKIFQDNWSITDNYNFVDCNRESIDLWNCSCYGKEKKIVFISNKNNNILYDFMIQFYTAPLKEIPKNYTPEILGMPSNEEIFNEKNKVIVNINNITLINREDIPISQDDIDNFFNNMPIKYILIIIFFVLFIFIFFVIKYIKKTFSDDDSEKEELYNIDEDKELLNIIEKVKNGKL